MKFGMLTQIGPLSLKFSIFQKQDGGGSHLEKSKNYDITASDWPIFAKFGMIMQNGSPNHPDR